MQARGIKVLLWALLLTGGARFLLGQTISIDCGSSSDQFFSCSPPACDKFTISTPGATGDLTLRYGAVKYNIPAAPGAYDVILYLRETGTVTGPGQRSFNVSINGQPVLLSYDLFANAGLAPIQKSFQATSSGFIAIDFSYNVIPGQVVRGAVVSRIDVRPKPQPPANPAIVPGFGIVFELESANAPAQKISINTSDVMYRVPVPVAGSDCQLRGAFAVDADAQYFCIQDLPIVPGANPWGHWVAFPRAAPWVTAEAPEGDYSCTLSPDSSPAYYRCVLVADQTKQWKAIFAPQ